MDNLELIGEHIHSVRFGLLFDALANSMPQAVALLGTAAVVLLYHYYHCHHPLDQEIHPPQ